MPFSMDNALGWILMTSLKFRCVKDILTLLKYTSNKYRPLTVLYRNSIERPCRKSISARYTIFNWEQAVMTLVNVSEFCCNPRKFTEVIERTDGQTDKQKS